MPSNRPFTVGPVIMSATLTTNIFNCNITSLAGPVGFTLTQPFALFYRIRIVNKTGTAATFSLWKGLTGANTAGTEVIGQGLSVPANFAFDYGGRWRFDAADFLVGGAGTASALTIVLEGEIGFS